ncbi:hypothetical protein GW17_00034683 [Ensete ventricosum]|nr:hypothetical protein GW17_00034683 [Ensete ventricosum]
MRVVVCLSIDQGELLGGHSGVEVGGRKGRGSGDESSGAQLPKSKASIRKEVDSEEHHSAAERIYRSRRNGCRCKATDSKAWAWQHHGTQKRDFRGVIDPLFSWKESIGRKRSRGSGEYKGKLQVPRQGGRAEAQELHKTGVDGLLIKIAESERLRVDKGVLDQGTK